MHDAIFENQRALNDEDLATYGEGLALDRNRLLHALDDDETLSVIEHDFSTGIRSGVNGTPGFFINGLRHDGPWEFDDLMAALVRAIGEPRTGA